jgi:uncharacterized protein YggE
MIMKKALSIAVLMVLVSLSPLQAQDSHPRLITVTGESEVKVIPDEVEFSLGLTTSDEDLATAKKLNNDRVKNLLALTKALGIEPRDVQTDYLSIEPSYYKGEHFTVSRNVVITLRNVSQYDPVLTRLVQNNRANSLRGINFHTSQLRKFRDQARAMAAQAAREKADALAKALGVKAGAPYTITEESSYWSYWGSPYNNFSMNSSMNSQRVAIGNSESASPSATLAPGQISVSARLTVSFELEK